MKNYIVVADVTDQNGDGTTRVYVSDQYGRTFSVHQSDAFRFTSKYETPVVSGFRPVSLVPHGTLSR